MNEPTPAEMVAAAAAAEEMLRRRGICGDLGLWCWEALRPFSQVPAKHHELIIRELEWLSRTPDGRLMIFAPPGSAKTRYVSELFAVWYLAQAPGLSLIGASHTATFAEDISRRVMHLAREHSRILGFDIGQRESAELWDTTQGGRYRSVGVGGAITGTRCDLALIDDPVRGRADAESETARNVAWNWYRNDLLTRMNPGGRIVLIMTRWHMDDLGGRLLEAEPDKWRRLSLPAIAEDNDALGREVGEPLWGERESLAQLESKRATMGTRDFESLFQQHPTPQEGGVFQVDKLHVTDVRPECSRTVRGWDLAATSGGDWTVGCKMSRTADDQYVIEDIIRFRGDSSQVTRTIEQTAKADGNRVTVCLPIDPGQAGMSQTQFLTCKLAGYTVRSSRESGDKTTRAMPFASQLNVGNVTMMRGSWNREYAAELGNFPGAKWDDCVDASSRSFNELATKPSWSIRMVSVGFDSRPAGIERYADGRRTGIDRSRVGERHEPSERFRSLDKFLEDINSRGFD